MISTKIILQYDMVVTTITNQTSSRVSDVASKWVRLAPNGINEGLFRSDFSVPKIAMF